MTKRRGLFNFLVLSCRDTVFVPTFVPVQPGFVSCPLSGKTVLLDYVHAMERRGRNNFVIKIGRRSQGVLMNMSNVAVFCVHQILVRVRSEQITQCARLFLSARVGRASFRQDWPGRAGGGPGGGGDPDKK